MIPIKVCVEGFMCYRDRAEFIFDGAPLWILTGANGVGKSTVFDAITYVLYGSHRLGNSRYGELISKNSTNSSMIVEFDFAIDDRLFRVKRTHHSTGRPTFQAWEFIGGYEEANLVVIPGTDKSKGFQEKIEEIIGLDEKAFKSAVLLRQGEADALLKANPSERHPILAQIVDLSKYENLYKRADTQRKEHESNLKYIESRLQMPVVDPFEIQRLSDEIENTVQELKTLGNELEEKIRLKEHAVRWEKLNLDKKNVEKNLTQFEQLINQEDQIKMDAERFEDLKLHLPVLEDLLLNRKKLEVLNEKLSDYESVNNRIKSLEVSLKEIEVARHELPYWKQYFNERKNWQQAKTESSNLENKMRRISDEIAETEIEYNTQIELLNKVDNACRLANTNYERAKINLDEAKKKKERFSDLEGKAECDWCGQLLTEDHRNLEATKIEERLTDAERKNLEAKEEFQTASKNFDAVREQTNEIHRRLENLKRDDERNHAALENEEKRKTQAEKQAAQSLASISESAEKQFGSIENIELCFEQFFPSNEDLIDMENRSQVYSKRKSELEELTKKQREMNDAQIELRLIEPKVESLISQLLENWRSEADNLTETRLRELKNEKTKLNQAPQKLVELQQAQNEKNAELKRLNDIAKELETVAEGARRPALVIETEITQLKQQKVEVEKRKSGSESQKSNLESQRKARAELEKEQKDVRHKAKLYKDLSDLLGREKLQRWLLLEAEKTIVYHANNFLERISNRSIELELNTSNSDDGSLEASKKALDLKAIYQIEEGKYVELPVDSLSGGQKFRVAVSLALGIGQYASTGTRRLESVIIDEGFGSLDADGRNEMIDEIKSLKDILQRIIIVSHQEEVAKAFPTNKYAISKVNGTSIVELVDDFE